VFIYVNELVAEASVVNLCLIKGANMRDVLGEIYRGIFQA